MMTLILLGACGGSVAPASSSTDGGTGGTTSPTPPAPPAPPTPPPPKGTCNDCLGDTLLWYSDGGEVAYTGHSQISACRTYTHERIPSDPKVPTLACTTQVGDCGSKPVSVREIEAALAHPDVVAALSSETSLYGSDPRGCDGTVLRVQVGTKLLEIGDDCSQAGNCGGSHACTPVTTGLQALADVLSLVDKQELEKVECSAFR
jgi:hypothetical protein